VDFTGARDSCAGVPISLQYAQQMHTLSNYHLFDAIKMINKIYEQRCNSIGSSHKNKDVLSL